MKRVLIIVLAFIANAGLCFAQASGNIAYSQASGSTKAKQNERAKRVLAQGEIPPSATSMFIEANVLMNVKADEYVAVFGLSQEGATVVECNQNMDAAISRFSNELQQLEINRGDVFVDFAAQNKIYRYEVEKDIAREKLVGFELKKNISIHFRDKTLLDKLVIAASRSNIFDLIKVDYIVSDPASAQNRVMEEAARIIKQKAARYEKLLDIKLQGPGQVYAEKPSIYFPTEMYDSYTAYESESIDPDYYRRQYIVQRARKSTTFFFNGLSADGFDYVINQVVIEPVVQFTLYLKVKYEMGPSKDK